ncbi:MAG: phage gp6-like head-tail connector protein [Oscillospiraceae bacterium]|jgi:hypothetical protein|nr:phage gp6-like head-tail connector protein [Oscillospiraceae bacterium]
MIFSGITVDNVILKLRLNKAELTQQELDDLAAILDEVRRFVISYTGLTTGECDQFEDLCAAVFVLCQDLYDNRSFYVDKSHINQVIRHILDMHSVNYI